MQQLIKYIIINGLLFFSSFLSALEVGDVISNTASVEYAYHGASKRVTSNTTEHTIEQSEAKVSFMYVTQGGTQTAVLGTSAYLDDNGVWHEGETSTLPDGTVLANGTPLNIEDTDFYRQKDVAVVTVVDADQNYDRDVRNVIDVNVTSENGDIETIQLIETTKDSGVFVAYIPLSTHDNQLHDNQLYVELNENIHVNYDDVEIVRSDSAVILEKKDFNVWIEKQVNKTEASLGELLQYRLVLHNEEDFAITSFEITDDLPLGLKYEIGTAKIADKKAKARLSEDGTKVNFMIPRVEPKAQVEVTFIASVTAGVENGKVVNEAWVSKNTVFKSNVARVTTKIKEELMRSKGVIVGKIYNEANRTQGISGIRLYLENGMYVVSDEKGKYHFAGVDAGRHVVQVDKGLLPQGYEMGTCEETSRRAGKNFSELINLGRGALKRVDFCLKRNKERVDVTDEVDNFVEPTEVLKMPTYGVKDLKNKSKRAILWPPKKYVPEISSTRIAIKHPRDEKIEVYLNGNIASALNRDGNVVSKASSNVIDLYKGVDLLKGKNVIEVVYFSKTGKELTRLTREIHLSLAPVQIKYLKEKSKTLADGKHSPVIAVKFYDESGQPLRSGMSGTFSVEAPYASQNFLDQLQNNPLATTAAQSRYTIHSDGIAYIKLQPTTESGEVTLHFQLQERDEVVRAWLKPALREWIMVGFAEGTVGYNTLKGNADSLGKLDAKEKTITEGRVSFFAKGRIKGDWLLSMAYDTGKDTSKELFLNEIDPNAYYTLYGDNSQQNQEAASRKKLYVKLEKEQFNILFGDFSTDLSYTELSAYSRRFTGVKSEYHGEHVEAKAFATHTEQLFVKDEIRGDGTSGYYYLKAKDVVQFSEKVSIEVRNRYRTQDVISTKTLRRFRDYEIDYALGRIYFKAPIYSNDEQFNPRYIVVDYEVSGDNGEHYTYGGRAAVKGFNEKLELGSTYLSEDSGKKKSKLLGVDTTIQVGKTTRIKAEYAKTKTTEESVSTTGDAKLVELEHMSDGLYTRAYYREQASAFGLGQLNGSLGGTRKVGVDVAQEFSNRQTNRLSLYRDTNLLSGMSSDVLDFRTEFNNLTWTSFLGYRYAKESADDFSSQQLLLGGSYSLFDQRLRLSAQREQTISSDESKQFPTKTTLGLDYALSASTELFSAYEWSDELEQGRVGLRVRPWSGMTVENTTLTELQNDQQNVYNTLGGMQTYQLNDALSFNVGYEKGQAVSKGVVDNNLSALASKDFSAYRVGFNYNENSYSANVNAELRKSEDEEKRNLSASVYTQTSNELALALGASSRSDSGKNRENSNHEIQLSLAYRPEEEDMLILEKLAFVKAKQEGEAGHFVTEKTVNNLNVNLMLSSKSELSLQHGFKYVTDSIDAFDSKGISQLFGVDTHYDVSSKWEIGLQGSLLYAQSANNMDYGLGLYSGHNLFDNMVLTVGYNWKGFEDQDFSLQTYRVEGPYFRFNMKFDQDSLKDTVRMMSW